MGVLTYSPELAAAVDAATEGVELPAGPHELALRAAAVTAVDTLARASAAAGHPVSASQLSCFLLAQADSGGHCAGRWCGTRHAQGWRTEAWRAPNRRHTTKVWV